MTQPQIDLTTIGRAEMLVFLDVEGRPSVPAKIDTGAYRSAIHAENIRVSDDGKTLYFTVFGNHPTSSYAAHDVETTEFKQVTVENSFGHSEKRYEAKLRVRLAGKIFTAGFSLADRSKKNYAILIGRRLINKKYLVNTAQTGVDRLALKEQFALNFPRDEEDS